MNKLGLILEGGGMRGAYTAGCLTWMIQNNIEADYGVGISAGALNICNYFLKDEKLLHDTTVIHTADKKNIGLYPILHEGRYVGYNYMFDQLLLKDLKYNTSSLREKNSPLEFGVYDMEKCETIFYNASHLDDELRMLKAACTLPIAGNIVYYNGMKMLDGGISVMIPIERALEKGCNRNIVIVTKPEGYVRKAAGAFMRWFMKFNYPNYPKMVHNYINRHESYHAQMNKIEEEIKKGRCILIRPSISIPVKRFSGDPENLKKLYELGIQDMENRKAEILEFINK